MSTRTILVVFSQSFQGNAGLVFQLSHHKSHRRPHFQGCTNLRRQAALETEVLTVAPLIFGPSVWTLFRVTLLAPWILKWLLDILDDQFTTVLNSLNSSLADHDLLSTYLSFFFLGPENIKILMFVWPCILNMKWFVRPTWCNNYDLLIKQ